MTADAAVGLFALACVTVSTLAWLLIAGAWRLWPFRDEESEGTLIETAMAHRAEDFAESGVWDCTCVACGTTRPAALDYWSGENRPGYGESRHGDDGNSGHG